jgi:hypothetical protein
MLVLSGGQAELLFDLALPVEVTELPADLAGIDRVAGRPIRTCADRGGLGSDGSWSRAAVDPDAPVSAADGDQGAVRWLGV